MCIQIASMKKKIEGVDSTVIDRVRERLGQKSVQSLSISRRGRLIEKEFKLSAGIAATLVRLHQMYSL